MYQRIVLASLLSAYVGSAAEAEQTPLNGAAIIEVVAGATIHLDTPLGTTLPVKYTADGQISGEAGALSVFLGQRSDHGRWWVHNDRLCHKWAVWFDAKLQCLTLTRDGKKLAWRRDDGETGTATIAPHTEPLGTPPAALGGAEPQAQAPAQTLPEAQPPAHPQAAKPAAPPPTKPVVAAAPAAPSPPPVASAASASNSPAPLKRHAGGWGASVPASPPPAAKPQTPPPKVVIAAATVQPPRAPPTPAHSQATFRVARVASYDVLNVRQGPSADTPVVGAIPHTGSGVSLAGTCVREWCPVRHRGTSGWVNRVFLIAETPRAAR